MLVMGLRSAVRSSPRAPATLIPLAVGSWWIHPGQGQLGWGHRVTQGSTTVLAVLLLLVTAWSGGEWNRTVMTRRRQWGQREHDGNQEEILEIKVSVGTARS